MNGIERKPHEIVSEEYQLHFLEFAMVLVASNNGALKMMKWSNKGWDE